MGILPIEITSASNLYGRVLVNGRNFTEYSVILVDATPYETAFISSAQIVAIVPRTTPVAEIAVAQIAADGVELGAPSRSRSAKTRDSGGSPPFLGFPARESALGDNLRPFPDGRAASQRAAGAKRRSRAEGRRSSGQTEISPVKTVSAGPRISISPSGSQRMCSVPPEAGRRLHDQEAPATPPRRARRRRRYRRRGFRRRRAPRRARRCHRRECGRTRCWHVPGRRDGARRAGRAGRSARPRDRG